MLLHEIPEGSIIRIECGLSKEDQKERDITFHHLDGMYSYCTVEIDGKEHVLHLSASAPLRKIIETQPDGSVIEFYMIHPNLTNKPKK